MPRLTALLHTNNDALRLGRCLETLYLCDHILVVAATPNASPDHYAQSAAPGWILALDPRESVTEGLAASLFDLHEEWKLAGNIIAPAYSMFVREETADGWVEIAASETRLVPHTWNRWNGNLPVREPSAFVLEGELLRFTFP